MEANQQGHGETGREKCKKEGANKLRKHKARCFMLLKKVREAHTGDATGKGWEQVLQERALNERAAKAAMKKKMGEESKVDAEDNGPGCTIASEHSGCGGNSKVEQRKPLSEKGWCRTNWFLNSVANTSQLNCVKSTQCFVVEGVHANKPSWNTIKLWGENKMIAADTWHPWVTVALLHGWGKQGCIVKCEVVSQKREACTCGWWASCWQ